MLQIDVVNVQEQARQMMHLHMIVENGCEWMGGHWQKEQDADGANSCAVGRVHCVGGLSDIVISQHLQYTQFKIGDANVLPTTSMFV